MQGTSRPERLSLHPPYMDGDAQDVEAKGWTSPAKNRWGAHRRWANEQVARWMSHHSKHEPAWRSTNTHSRQMLYNGRRTYHSGKPTHHSDAPTAADGPASKPPRVGASNTCTATNWSTPWKMGRARHQHGTPHSLRLYVSIW